MKKLFISLILLLFLNICALSAIADDICIPKGTFFRVINIRELYSPIMDEGDTVSFLMSEPLYIRNHKLFPANSIMFGYVAKINEPVEGINASMKIKITKIYTPDEKEYDIKGTVISGGNDYIGGDLTPVRLYKKTPHFIKGLGGGVLQLTPTNFRYYGENLTVKAGAELFVALDEDFIFTP